MVAEKQRWKLFQGLQIWIRGVNIHSANPLDLYGFVFSVAAWSRDSCFFEKCVPLTKYLLAFVMAESFFDQTCFSWSIHDIFPGSRGITFGESDSSMSWLNRNMSYVTMPSILSCFFDVFVFSSAWPEVLPLETLYTVIHYTKYMHYIYIPIIPWMYVM